MSENLLEQELKFVLDKMYTAMQKEKNGETWSQFKEDLICPYCKHIDEDSFMAINTKDHEEIITCRNKSCGKEYDVKCSIQQVFSTKKRS